MQCGVVSLGMHRNGSNGNGTLPKGIRRHQHQRVLDGPVFDLVRNDVCRGATARRVVALLGNTIVRQCRSAGPRRSSAIATARVRRNSTDCLSLAAVPETEHCDCLDAGEALAAGTADGMGGSGCRLAAIITV